MTSVAWNDGNKEVPQIVKLLGQACNILRSFGIQAESCGKDAFAPTFSRGGKLRPH
jgi:hypothetical protein